MGVKVYPNGALGNERDTIEQLKIGGLDMMRINVAPLNNVVPETIVPALPFLFRSEEHMHAVLDGPVGDEILAAMEAQGMVGLAFYDSGARSMYTATKPIKSLADVQHMKIRVQQSDLFVAMVEALGANPTPMPFGEVYTALKTGIVDAAENNFPSYESSRQFEAAKYYTLTEHSMAPEVLVFSKVIWDTLTPEDQAKIRKAAKDSVPVHARSLGRARGEVGGRRSRPAVPRSCRSRTGRPGSTRCSRSTRSSRTRRSCRAWSRRSRPRSRAGGEAALARRLADLAARRASNSGRDRHELGKQPQSARRRHHQRAVSPAHRSSKGR